jgi:protein involved in polysaccharide export with SLBB domain
MTIRMTEKTRNKKFLAVMLFGISLSLVACATPARNTSPASSAAELMPSYVAQAQEYRIRSGDQLDIKFYYNPELNEQVPVRPDGRISLQLAHEIMAAGLTPAELTDVLTKTYASELDKPEVTVIVRSFGGQMVFVDGEVNKPGMLNLIAPMTVLQSLSQAGGVKDTAKRNEIVIIRRGPDNKPIVLMMNMDKVIDGTETSQDVNLLPDDIVVVPKSSIANVNMWVDQYIRKNIPINVGAGYYYNYGHTTNSP